MPDAALFGSGPTRSLKGALFHVMGALSGSFLLGLEDVERVLGRSARKGGDGYPPYNVERFPKTEDRDELYRITIAVAGFTADDLEVTTADNQLVIRGRQAEDVGRTYLYRGIAARRFQKSFLLGEGLTVLGADLKDGLLSIDLARPNGGRGVRSVTINGAGQATL
jgi:HSP20 family molecular chaperone IbpA